MLPFKQSNAQLNAFENWLAGDGLNIRTRAAYVSRVRQYLNAVDGDGQHFQETNRQALSEQIQDFVHHCSHEWSYSQHSINGALTALNKYFEFIGVPVPEMRRTLPETALPKVLSKEEEVLMRVAITAAPQA